MLGLMSLLPLLSLLASALAQSSAYTDQGIAFNGYTEPRNKVQYGFVLPPTTATGASAQEFIGEFVSPVVNKWVGIALGGQMADNLMVMAWPNGQDIVFTSRYATGDTLPFVYPGPTISTISSSVNATHWSWIYPCQNCTTWQGGSLDTSGTPMIGWGIGLHPVAALSNASTAFGIHDDADVWNEDLGHAHNANYNSFLTSVNSTSTSSQPTSPSSSAPSSSSSPTATPSSSTRSASTLSTVYSLIFCISLSLILF